ncbi:phosphoribosyltransferase [Geminocystis sp. NIES-3709]|uniref:phosphoribosyltransferase n=1 Tax=Geminocystis sp. NIES-3709 TaxID=1617448 RepID=UPI0005FC5D86|nr:phosphoribosyltransferase family protein [Geminocystis sp. NIES-3709]BAQ64061.1 phosphoribosyltransferase [Geminocystis sp. NIES-3709]
MTETAKNQKELEFTWKQFREYCEVVATAIISSKKSYSQIIAIARGGFYLGDYLSRRLKLPLSVIVAQSYSKDNQQEELQWGNLSYINPPQDKVLLVDDLLDTGITMTIIKEMLEKTWNVEVDTAVIWQKSGSQYQGNYFYSVTPKDYWIKQPFE